jgi:transposase-like protein
MDNHFSSSSNTSSDEQEQRSKNTDLIDYVKRDCPKCDGTRARETNRVAILNQGIKAPVAFITRYKCVKCGYSWVKYETVKD